MLGQESLTSYCLSLDLDRCRILHSPCSLQHLPVCATVFLSEGFGVLNFYFVSVDSISLSYEPCGKCRLVLPSLLCVVFCLVSFFIGFNFPVGAFLVPGDLLSFSTHVVIFQCLFSGCWRGQVVTHQSGIFL